MSDASARSQTTGTLNGDQEALAHLRAAVVSGTHWFLALLDAVALWESAEETHQGVRYQYLVAHEAFDWLRLAERLADEIADFVPASELEALLFHGVTPRLLDPQEFRRRIGPAKYRAHLNFFYGVVVEEALLAVAEDDLDKEQQCVPIRARRDGEDAYLRVYGLSHAELLQRYRRERHRSAAENITLDELHEFTYWLFKYRLLWTDKARVASDTKRGLTRLHQVRSLLPPVHPPAEEPWIAPS